tara:strand:+ start:5026 stop:5400 length:375 start_codon:yes stop_codon:yes gene_type:complete
MSEYDDTNKGVAFAPWESEKLALTGKLNIEGTENEIMFIGTESRDGRKMLKLYGKLGVLFANELAEGSNQPHYGGVLDEHPDKKIAGWKNESNGKKYLQLKVSSKGERPPSPPLGGNDDDEIPF